MEIITTVAEMKARVAAWKAEGLTIGLTPTMGALHEGHMSLMEAARSACDRVVTSVFVNPLQFGPDEDYDNYPRDLERDAGIAESKGVDVVFHPSVEEMYPENYNTYVVMETLTDTLCGASRPGHFRGVCTVVNKLFNIVQPDKAFFGQKDAQQLAIIMRMVSDLNMNSARVAQAVTETIEEEPLARIDYVEVVNLGNMQPVETLPERGLVAIAVYIGSTRLIDNYLYDFE